jgi:hypothetical protein
MATRRNVDPEFGAFVEQINAGGFTGYIFVVTLLGCAFLLIGISSVVPGAVTFLTSALIIASVLLLTYFITKYLGKHYFIFYEQGVVFEENEVRRLALYREIKVWESIISILTGRTYFYTIRFPNNKRIFNTKRQIGQYLQSMIVQYQLPQVIDDYNQGKDIRFDFVCINQEGIAIDPKWFMLTISKKNIAWSDIGKITINNGLIHIKDARNWLDTAQIPVQSIPNLYVMLNLLQKIGYLEDF